MLKLLSLSHCKYEGKDEGMKYTSLSIGYLSLEKFTQLSPDYFLWFLLCLFAYLSNAQYTCKGGDKTKQESDKEEEFDAHLMEIIMKIQFHDVYI